MNKNIAIIGAGLSGLSCAYYLEKKGYSPVIYEAEDHCGGRLRTDNIEGFLLDRGFQLLITSYPEVKRLYRRSDLQLKTFAPGAQVWVDQKWQHFPHPFKQMGALFGLKSTTFTSYGDFVKCVSMYFKTFFETLPYSPATVRETALQFLEHKNFSSTCINSFFRPLSGTFFLDGDLEALKGPFLWLWRYFAEGLLALPAQGMQGLTDALIDKLTKTRIEYNSPITAVEGQTMMIRSKKQVKVDKIVIAGSAPATHELLSELPTAPSRSSVCLYFWIDKSHFTPTPHLHLNGTNHGPVCSLAFLNRVQPTYAPDNVWLACVSIVDPDWQNERTLVDEVKEQLAEWFSVDAKHWHYLRTYRIPHAVPDLSYPPPEVGGFQLRKHPDIYLCGEMVDIANFEGGLGSGRRAAEQIHKDILAQSSL